MTLETDMKSLVDDILVSRDDRAKAVENIRKDTYHILGEAKKMMKDFAKEDEERAVEVKKLGREVKSFLKSSAESRKADFQATMKTVQGSLENVRKDSKHARNAGKTIVKDARILIVSIAKDNKEQAKELHEELKKSDIHRKTEFKSMMADIGEDLKEVKGDVAKVKKDTRDMVSRYHHSRMIGQKHWASLSQRQKKAEKSVEKKTKEQKAEE
ncbi:MAG: hypothetical protein Q8N56_03415 [bacterium]|nr:hypothetical protein [bacterium]